jgi:hypothetical protein
MMQTKQPDRIFSQSPAGQATIQTAANYGLMRSDENGNASFNEDKRKELESQVEEGKDALVASQDNADVPLSTLTDSNYAGSFIGKDRMNTQADRIKAAEIVQKELHADSHGTKKMTAKERREAQKTHYQAAKASYTNPKPNAEMLAHKALAHAYGQTLRDGISDEDKPLYDKLTKTSQDLTRVKELKKRLDGKKIPKKKGMWETFLKQGARIAEAYIGDKIGGPIGAVIGATAGEYLNRQLDKRFGRNIFETKGIKEAMDVLHNSKPKEYEKLMEALKKRGVKVSEPNGKKTEKEKAHEVKKGLKGLVDSGAQKGEREIKEGEVLKNGGRIRMDMKTGKKYVSY